MTTYLSSGDLSVFRATMQRMLPDTATIQRRTAVSDGGGGRTYTWATLSTAPARISPVAGGEATGTSTATRGDRVVDESTHIVTFAYGTVITESDRVVIGGVTYEVLLVRRRGAWGMTERVEVRKAP